MLRYRQSLFFATLVLALAVPTAAVAAPAGRDDLLEPAPTQGPISSSVRPQVLSEPATVEVMVQLDGDPVAVAEAKADRRFTAAERRRLRQAIRADQDGIVDDVTTAGGTVTGQVQSAYNGVRVRIGSKAVDALADLPGVAGVHAITPKSFDNTTAVAFLGVPAVWQDTGRTGQGVTVGIIDTGIDYTHPDLAANIWTNPGEKPGNGIDDDGNGYVDDVHGYDFANNDGNPMDDHFHGTHVAGTIGAVGDNGAGVAGLNWKVKL
ncbi:MAG: S8 family serine peptidase, partial [Propionicimonas sp.]